MFKKTEGNIKKVSDEIEDITLGVNKEIPEELDKIEKDDKQSFEDFKVLYKGIIDIKFKQDYGIIEDENLWEDTAKELYLQSKNYILVGDEYKAKEVLDNHLEKVEESAVHDLNNKSKKIESRENDVEVRINKAKEWKQKVDDAVEATDLEEIVDEILEDASDLEEINFAGEDLIVGMRSVLDNTDAQAIGPVTYVKSVKLNMHNILDDFIDNYEQAFNEESLEESKVVEQDLGNETYTDADEAEYYRNKELYKFSCLARHKEAMEKAKEACLAKGIKLDESKVEEANKEIDREQFLIDNLFSWIEDHIVEDDRQQMLQDLKVSEEQYEGTEEIKEKDDVINNAVAWILDHCHEDDIKKAFDYMIEDELIKYDIKLEESRDWTPEEIKKASDAMKKQGHLGYEEFIQEWNKKKEESIEDIEQPWVIKLFYNEKFIGYLNSYSDFGPCIRIFAGNDLKYIKKFKNQKGANISKGSYYMYGATQINVFDEENVPTGTIPFIDSTVSKTHGIDRSLFKAKTAQFNNEIGDVAEIKIISEEYLASL